MDYSNFLGMRDELSLLVVIVLLFLYDTFGSVKSLKCFSATACVLLLAHTIFTIVPGEQVSLFGGMYQSGPATSVIKTILNIGTLLVLIQASSWIKNEDVIIRRGEYYVLTLITLLGMYLMTSSGNFLLFFLGLETASLPLPFADDGAWACRLQHKWCGRQQKSGTTRAVRQTGCTQRDSGRARHRLEQALYLCGAGSAAVRNGGAVPGHHGALFHRHVLAGAGPLVSGDHQ